MSSGWMSGTAQRRRSSGTCGRFVPCVSSPASFGDEEVVSLRDDLILSDYLGVKRCR